MSLSFAEELKVQRWDDHRYYHQSRINQSLHFVSALSFLFAYYMLFIDPAKAALVGWLVSMMSRQSGHFFFEPKGYDHINDATHEYKEEIKVGYNLRRKVVLMAVWALAPALLFINPTLFGLFEMHQNKTELLDHVGLIWLAVSVGALIVRVLQLAVTQNLRTGIIWVTKIITDPFHDVMLYHKAPLALMRGELVAQSPHG